MKRTIYIMISVTVACLCLNACDSWLDVDPSDQYSTETFWKTEEHASAGLMGCYNALMPWRSLHTMEFDMLTSNAMPYNEANGTQAIGKGEHLSTNDLVKALWKNCYTGIGRTNTFIANVPSVDMDESEKAKMVGEVKFLRAFYYLNLADKFGGVPLITDAPDADAQESLPRNSKEEVVTQILKDLDDAAAVLPDNYASADLGRATKGAALALKARVLLYNSRWAEAAAAAKQVMDLKVYKLFNDYRHFFSEANKHNSEVIFNVETKIPEYTTDYDAGIYRLNRPAPLKELVDMYLCTDGKTIEESAVYDPEKPYENRDPRLLKSINCIGYPYLGKITTLEDVVTTGFGVKKYTSYEDDVSIPLVERSAFNFILIRYAEVLLTYAEAQNEAVGPDQSVYDAINQLRKRPDINMPEVPKGLTQDQMREVIRRERRIELTFEGLYYSDILRWKTAEKENNGVMHNYEGVEILKRAFNPKRDYLWPIPYNQTVLNPNLGQNPNWD
ncbi:RagB/SusD family nutrient uptake outer membrane protein [Parabacteroides sp.]